mmetsp:Transcript_3885/g.11235  ORF Transcript_3885/g.11235 Transcript_3885/m.11235 type:complete len:202 (+) Transcript_3885:80-685(+)
MLPHEIRQAPMPPIGAGSRPAARRTRGQPSCGSNHQGRARAQPVVELVARDEALALRREGQGAHHVLDLVQREGVIRGHALRDSLELLLAEARLRTSREEVLGPPALLVDRLLHTVELDGHLQALRDGHPAEDDEVEGADGAEERVDVRVPQRSEDHGGQEEVPDATTHEARHEEHKLVNVEPELGHLRVQLHVREREVQD